MQFDQVDSAARALGVCVEHAVAHGKNRDIVVADVRIFLGANQQRKLRFHEG